MIISNIQKKEELDDNHNLNKEKNNKYIVKYTLDKKEIREDDYIDNNII